jgi:hypothetical protein
MPSARARQTPTSRPPNSPVLDRIASLFDVAPMATGQAPSLKFTTVCRSRDCQHQAPHPLHRLREAYHPTLPTHCCNRACVTIRLRFPHLHVSPCSSSSPIQPRHSSIHMLFQVSFLIRFPTPQIHIPRFMSPLHVFRCQFHPQWLGKPIQCS